MSHDYDTIEEFFGSEFVDAKGMTYSGKCYDVIISGEATEIEYRAEGQRTIRVLSATVRVSDFASGHPSRRATCAIDGVTYRIDGRTESSTGKTYILRLVQQHQ